jgi:hypothetical protein
MTRHHMRVDELAIDVHLPFLREDAGKNLAFEHFWPVHDTADYADLVPEDWCALAGPDRGVFFIGVPKPGEEHRDRELWFDFRTMEHDSHFLAVLITVQGLNAVTNLPIAEEMKTGLYKGPGRPTLEQYKNTCPAHGTPLGAHRMCKECGFRWPPQNYITNAAGRQSIAQFWRDGHQSNEGKILQFAIRPTEAGLGVAQQILGECRNLAIDIAVFRSHDLKPRPTYRRERHPELLGGGGYKGIGGSLGGGGMDTFGGGLESLGSPTRGGGETRGGVIKCASLGGSRSTGRIGAPASMEIGAGREVEQKVHADPNKPEFWADKPCAMFTLIPTDQAWTQEVTKNGPTTRTVKHGPLAGIKRA